MKTIRTGQITLAYERHGKGFPLLLAHGFPLDHSTWETLVPHLENDFDLILPDLRGFGQSDAPEGAYTMDQMATDLGELLAQLEIQQCFIAGHSMGGYVAQAFARNFPTAVLGLGLIGSQTAADTPDRKTGRYATAQQVREQGPAVVAGMAEKLSANPDLTAFLREIILRQKPAGLSGALQAMATRPDGMAGLATLGKPLVLVHGLADALIPPERSREILAAIPSSQLTELPGVGHSPALEAPLETAKALRQLLKQ